MRELLFNNPNNTRQVKVRIGLTAKELLDTIDFGQYLYTDMETYNDTKHYKGGFYGKVRIVTFKQAHWDFVIAVDVRFDKDITIELIDTIVRDNAYIVGYNFAYDYSTVQEHRGNLYKEINLEKYVDLLIIARDLYPLQKSENVHGRYSLDDTYTNVLGFDPYLEFGIDKKVMQKAKWGEIVDERMYLYASLDVEYLPLLHSYMAEEEDRQYPEEASPKTQAYNMRLTNAHLAVDVGLKMQSVGLVVDTDKGLEYYNKYKSQEKQALIDLKAFGVPDDFNPTSTKQVREFTGLPATDKVTLKFAQHRDNNRMVALIMKARQGKSRKGVVTKWSKLVKDYGRVYGHYQPTTTTGRFSSSQENMQNQPRDSKDVFTAPDNAVLIGFDYAQIELRTMCALTGDERMYETFKTFGDIHANTKDMCGISERSIAKQVNFGNLYGMGVAKFQELLIKDDIYLDEGTLSNIKKKFFETYKRIPEYHEIGVHNSKHGIPNRSILGHPYYSRFFNQMNNLANQASGTSEIAKMFFRFAKEVGLINTSACELAVQIHDSNLFYYYGDTALLNHYATAIGILAQKAWFSALSVGYELGTSKYSDIPMPVEVGTSTHWKSIDDNIIVDLQGTEYISNPKGWDDWLNKFKEVNIENSKWLQRAGR